MSPLAWDALIFDVDGTLALTAGLHFDAMAAAAAHQGVALDPDWYAARKGLDRTALAAALAGHLRATSPMPFDPDRFSRDSLALTIDRAAQVAVEHPPVAALARRLAGRLPLAVGSNAETPVVEAVLRGAGLAGLFGALVTVSDTGRAKPDPAIFLLAADRLGIRPESCLVLEDSDEGLEAARRAGMTGWDVRRPAILAAIDRFAR